MAQKNTQEIKSEQVLIWAQREAEECNNKSVRQHKRHERL